MQCSFPINAYPSLDRINMQERTIHYLHGYIKEGTTPVEGTVVLSRDEFSEAYINGGNVKNLIAPTLENEDVLFVGCGLKDSYMEEVFKVCKNQQENRQRVIAEMGYPQSNPPTRFILQSIPEVTIEGEIDKEQSKLEMEKQDDYFTNLGIKPVWYEAYNGDHSALWNALQNLANLPEVTPDHGWQGGNDVP